MRKKESFIQQSLVLILILAVSTGIKANAQLQVMPEAGVSILKKKNLTATVSPRIGMRLNYNFQGEQGWAVASGLYFYQKKEAYTTGALRLQKPDGTYQEYPFTPGVNGIDYNGGINQFSIKDFDTKRDYLQIPLLAQYKWKLNENYAVSIAAGPYFAIGVGGKNKFSETVYSVPNNTSSIHQESWSTFDLYAYDRFDMGIASQVAIQAHNIVCNLGYEVNLYRHSVMGREHNITIGIGYLF